MFSVSEMLVLALVHLYADVATQRRISQACRFDKLAAPSRLTPLGASIRARRVFLAWRTLRASRVRTALPRRLHGPDSPILLF